MKYYKDHPRISAWAKLDVTAPLEYDRVDIAVKAARSFPYDNSVDRVISLIMIAQSIEAGHSEQLFSLLREAGELLNIISTDNSASAPDQLSLPTSAMFLAAAYFSLKKEDQAQQWLQWGTTRMSPAQVAYWKLFMQFPPGTLITGEIDKSTFSPEQIAQFNSDVHAYSQLLEEDDDTMYQQFVQLINMQVTLGQKDEARVNVDILEKHFKQQIARKKYAESDIRFIAYAVNIAQIWKRIGDQKRRDDVIDYLFDLPQDKWSSSKIQRISFFIKHRMINEGLRLFHSLSPAQQKEAAPMWQHWGEYFADANPDQFPGTIFKDIPLKAKAGFLHSFVNSITKSTFTHNDMWVITHDKCYYYDGVPDGDSCS